jgi:Fe-S-cluster-containing dehydrogenase component
MKSFPASRREFFQFAAAGIGTTLVSGCNNGVDWAAFFQKRFQEMSSEEIVKVLARLEKKYTQKYGKSFSVSATPAMKNTVFGFGLDLSKCIGCRKCVHACVLENNISRDVEIHYIRVIRMKDGESDLVKGDHYYDSTDVPEDGFYYLPVHCMQCENPPCVKVCPVNAMWQEPDGIVAIDYDWCIGCRDCMAACPYRAIKFNWTEPVIPQSDLNSDTDFLSNRPRVRGVVEKCHGCLHRTRKGLYPACAEACPTGAWKFGNLLDPDSEIRLALDQFRTFKLKAELNTDPKCFYFFSTG